MVTAILPAMISPRTRNDLETPAAPLTPTNGHTVSPSISSELTITQLRHLQRTSSKFANSKGTPRPPAPTRLAGFVGLFTGFGALVALVLFLPLPTTFRNHGIDSGTAVAYSYYVVGAVAFGVAVFVFIGLRNLAGEEEKSLVRLFKPKDLKNDDLDSAKAHSYARMMLEAVRLGFRNATLALAYLGGFVARASSVGISLFIPLFVNAWFISSGLCDKVPDKSEAVHPPAANQCRRAYVVAAELTGVSQLIALICAPVFGYMADRYPRFNAPLLLAALIGILGYISLESPDPKAVEGNLWIFPIMALLGISQIGAIVCSLGLLSRSVLNEDTPTKPFDEETQNPSTVSGPNMNVTVNEQPATNSHTSKPAADSDFNVDETSGLLSGKQLGKHSRQHLKGSIAGIYSLAGGAGILLLTKLGGYLFDEWSPSAPFYMLALFNGILFVCGLACGISNLWSQG